MYTGCRVHKTGHDHSGRSGKAEWFIDRRNRIESLSWAENYAAYRDYPFPLLRTA